jgi:hypothetical protein
MLKVVLPDKSCVSQAELAKRAKLLLGKKTSLVDDTHVIYKKLYWF